MSKKGKTGKAKTDSHKSDYSPVYITLNASNNPALVGYVIKKTMEEASEYKVLSYLTINSGNPPKPPNCPPGGCQ